MQKNEKLILALPKGRILSEVLPLLKQAGIEPEPAFNEESARQLRFVTNFPNLDIIRVRSFDVATFVAFGAAQMGVVGNDVLLEFNYPGLYAPLDLGIGKCRISVAEPESVSLDDDPAKWSSICVATKYPQLTQKYFLERGVHAECIKLSGAIELAPQLGLCERVVDLVSTGATLRANGLAEIEQICEVTSRFIVNRLAWKTKSSIIDGWVEKFKGAVDAIQN